MFTVHTFIGLSVSTTIASASTSITFLSCVRMSDRCSISTIIVKVSVKAVGVAGIHPPGLFFDLPPRPLSDHWLDHSLRPDGLMA